jgi:hypothetical protein
MRFLGALGLGAVVAGVGLVYCVRRESLRTGEGYLAALRQFPAQTSSLVDDARRRGRLAVSEGLQAARMREEQVARRLTAAESSQEST